MGFLNDLFKPKAQPEDDAERSALVLQRLKARRGEETGKWLALMQDPTAVPPKGPAPTTASIDRREKLDEAPYIPPLEAQFTALSTGTKQALPESMGNETVEWVNKLFGEFERQTSDYNSTASGTDLILTVHRPSFNFESLHYDGNETHKRVSVFKGHIGSLHWAMLVQGYEERIDVYMISADEILNFTLNDIGKSGISPFLTLDSSEVGGHRVWNIDGSNLAVETIPALTRELLGDLIRIAAGTMSESELFADFKTELKLGETVAHGFASQPDAKQSSASGSDAAASSAAAAASSAPAAALAPALDNQRPIDSQLATWSACDALVKAIHQDLSMLTARENSLDPEKDEETVKHLRTLAAALRTLSGQASEVLSRQHPAAGSKKYNPS